MAADRHRALATRHDTLAVRYEAIVHIAAINERLCPAFKHALAPALGGAETEQMT